MQNRQKIAIVANQRSGTHALGAVLQRNGFVSMGEIFHSQLYSGEDLIKYARFQHYIRDRGIDGTDPVPLLPAFFDYVEGLAKGPMYVDLKYNTLKVNNSTPDANRPIPAPLALCASRGYVFVHLIRRNTLHQYVSGRVAGATGQYGLLAGQEPKRVAVRLDPDETVAEVTERQRVADAFSTWLGDYPSCTLYYESAFAHDNLTQEAILALAGIGVTIENPAIYWRKQGSDMRSSIANYDEIADALKKAALTPLLD